MQARTGFGLVGLAIFAISTQAQTINVRGKVSDGTGKAVANAILEIAKLKLKDTTAADGTFSITGSATALQGSKIQVYRNEVSFKAGVMDLSVAKTANVKIEIFDIQGNLSHREVHGNTARGSYRLDLRGKFPLNQPSIVHASFGDEARTFQYMPSAHESQAGNTMTATTPMIANLAKVAATVDTLKVTGSGFAAKTIALSSYDSTLNVTLDPAEGGGDRWGGLKNAPIKSSGCGKALGTISKSGTYKIASAGGRGDYIIDIPANYDKDTPYRLIFGMHCMGGTAARVAAKDNGDDLSGFYSIKTLADKDGIPAIHVAPQGNSDGTWNPTNDLQFFTDILNQVESNLCVDTTRVFVNGFSFGAMFSYALSLAYPERIRAVATYAPANWNFNPQPTNRKIPIAYYQTTGTTDGTCKWINNDANKTGGKYCLLQHAQDNGCDVSGEIKLATGGTHVVTEFKGCKPGYPVKFSSFNGGHQAVHTDQGSSGNWIEKEAWEFFKQF